MAADELRFKVTAEGADAAAKEVGKVADAVDKLEGTTAKVAVEADDQATPVIEGAQGAVDDLDGTDATVAVEADDEATAPLEGVQGAVDDLDGAGATVTADADDEATQTIEDVGGAVDGLDGATAEVAVAADDQATGTLDEVAGAVNDLDKATATVEIDANDNASDVLQDVEQRSEELDGQPVDIPVDVDDNATPDLNNIIGALGNLSELLGELPGALGEVGGLISKLGGSSAGAVAGLAGLATGLAAVAVKGVTQFQELAIAVDNFSTKTGASLDSSSRLIEVADDLSIGTETMEKSIGKMLIAAEKTPSKFDDIGASVKRTSDGNLDSVETFIGVISALNGIDDAGKRAVAGQAVFGNGWRKMSMLVGMSADDLRARLEGVSETKIVTEEQVAQGYGLMDAFDTISDSADDLFLAIGQSLAPAVAKLAPAFAGAMTAMAPLISGVADGLVPALEAVTPLITAVTDSVAAWESLKLPGWLTDIGQEFINAVSPVDSFKSHMQDMKEEFGGTPKLVASVGTAFEKLTKTEQDNAKATEESKKATEGAVKALADFADKVSMYVIGLGKANDQMADLASAFDQIGLREGVLANVFKLDEGPRKARDEIRTIAEGIDGLGETAKGVNVGDALSNNLKADKFLDAIDKLAPQIQSAVTKAFGSGGPEAAMTMANSYIDQVTAELGGKFSREQVAAMLGLDNIEATIAVAVEQSSLESAKRQLAILVGVGGQTPYTAQIALALEAGTITGEQAQTLIQAKLGDAKVPIPSALAQPQTAEALAGAQAALDAGVKVALPSKLDPSGAEKGTAAFVDGDHGTVVLPVKPDDGKLKATDRAIDAVATAERTALLMSQAESGTLNSTDRALDGVATAERTALIMAQAESGTLGTTAGAINAVANQPRTAQIASQAEAGTLGSTNAALNSVANRDRTANVGSQADGGDLNNTNRAIDAVANKPRTATIYVRTTASGVQLGNWTSPRDPTQGMAPTVAAEETMVTPTGGRVRVSRRRQPTTVNNITNNVIVPRIPSGRELERVSQRWSRVNGKR